jgi:DHA1 family bicyclomycin/chloramphenicol resistance-like MFS transporter
MSEDNRKGPGFREFVALMAMMMSLVALSIDTTLPALPAIGRDLGAAGVNASQLVISLLFLGFAVGQIFYGPLSDSAGRKPTVYLGFGLLILGTMLSLTARNFSVMLIGRFLQGLGVAGPRTITLALVRDQYEGRTMARVMSFVMTVFILVPIVAPALGQGILILADWRAIFGFYLSLVLVVSIWFGVRQTETLVTSDRIPFSWLRIGAAVREVLRTRIALGYTVAGGLVFGAFIGYLTSAQQIFQQQYGLGRMFPLFFGIIALSIGCASFVNAKLVMHHGMRALSIRSLIAVSALSILFLPVALGWSGHPPLWILMGYLSIVFFGIGILFGNLNALAMQPLGHIAGTGAAVVGFLSTLFSILLGTIIGQSYNGTVVPLVIGFAFLGTASLLVVYAIERAPLGTGTTEVSVGPVSTED